MPRNRQTTEELLAWAEGKAYIEIFVDGSTEIQMCRGLKNLDRDFETQYADCTLRKAILRAQRGEKMRVDTIFKSGIKR